MEAPGDAFVSAAPNVANGEVGVPVLASFPIVVVNKSPAVLLSFT